ncbi:MAG: UTP--glucose-1-phosphate uridylyltransferase [Bryobacter sp.]|nr:UTP--glucose-1-phosphate uridylyltransferase [Bryobacter sp.]
MKVRKAVLTAAGARQRRIPLQTLVDRDGEVRTVLSILLNEVQRARIEDVAVVVHPGDTEAYRAAAGDTRLTFLEQTDPHGYGHAILTAREFTAGEPFLHLVGDHLYVARSGDGCARRLLDIAEAESCSVSAVQATREHLLGRFGAVAGPLLAGQAALYRVETVREKPTPTEAEQQLRVAGLRAGMYLCFFGMHVLTPAVMEILSALDRQSPPAPYSLSDALSELARREKYLALAKPDRRYDLEAPYGLFTAQLALALAGRDRAAVLAQLTQLLAEEAASAPEDRA